MTSPRDHFEIACINAAKNLYAREEYPLDHKLDAAMRAARLTTELLSPVPVLTIMILTVAYYSTTTLVSALEWAGIAILFTCLIPTVVILNEVRQCKITDYYIAKREQRPLSLLIVAISVVAGLVILIISGAPQDITALLASIVAELAISIVVTLGWKVSLHATISAGALTALIYLFGSGLFWLAPMVVLVGWARVKIGAHTPAQVIAGAVLGATAAATVFSFLR